MRPYFTSNNTLNGRSSDAVHSCDFSFAFTLLTQMADASHILISELCHTVLFAAWRTLWVLLKACPGLRCHVLHVVIVGAKKQVIGANTSGVVTAVQYPQPVGDGAVVQFPRYAMRVYRAAVLADLAIPSVTTRACPLPTTIALGFTDSHPEPWRDRATRIYPVVNRTRAAAIALIGVLWGDGEHASAMGTCGFAYNNHVGTPISIGHATGCYQQRGGFVMPALYHIWR